MYIATKMSDLRAIFWEEFIALEMTIREKFPIFGENSPLLVCGKNNKNKKNKNKICTERS